VTVDVLKSMGASVRLPLPRPRFGIVTHVFNRARCVLMVTFSTAKEELMSLSAKSADFLP
jgi:hypothetical protein